MSLKISLDVTAFESPDRTYSISRYFPFFRHTNDGFAGDTKQFSCLISREPFITLLSVICVTSLTSEEALRLVVMPDEQGRYHFDEMGMEHLPEYLGYLVGYLGGPLAPSAWS